MNTRKLTFTQRQNFRRAERLNADNIRELAKYSRAVAFGYLRQLHISVRRGEQYGLSSGYQG